jgi:hypothetical protein
MGTAAINKSGEVRGFPPRGRTRSAGPALAVTIFEIAVAALWSHGSVSRDDVANARAVARVIGAAPSQGGVFGVIANGPPPFSELGFERLDPASAVRAYALAEWLCSTPPGSPRREGFVTALRTRLSIDDATSQRLRTLAKTFPPVPDQPNEALVSYLVAVEA